MLTIFPLQKCFCYIGKGQTTSDIELQIDSFTYLEGLP
jgi:hypothetical protein